MIHFNEKHQTLIASTLNPIKEKPEHGELCEHKRDVYHLEYYPNDFQKIILQKQMIIDLYNQIQQIESERQNEIFELPF